MSQSLNYITPPCYFSFSFLQVVSIFFFFLQFDSFLKTLKIDPLQMKLVTDGELPLRQCLHPEACYKKIDLPDYYNSFSDLRKDFKSFYSSPEDMKSVGEMIDCILLHEMVFFLFYGFETAGSTIEDGNRRSVRITNISLTTSIPGVHSI